MAGIGACFLCLALAACGTPPWKQAGATTASPVPVETVVTGTPSPTSSPTPTPTPTPVKVKVKNDLAKGSAKRQLGAGGVRLRVTYYSTLNMSKWTPAATKPLNLSMTASFPDGSRQDIFLSSVTVNTDVRGPDGPLSSPEPLTDQAPITPGYLVTSPSSYVKVFNLPAVETGATSLTLNLTYELLAQAAPKSKQYLRQSTNDTLVIALAP